MSAGTILAEIPWNKIKEALAKQGQLTPGRTGESISMSSLAERLTRLESNELQQAELVSNIAHQVSELTSALQIVSKRALVSLVLAGVAFLASLVSMILILTK